MAGELADKTKTAKMNADMQTREDMLETEDSKLTLKDRIKEIVESFGRRSTGNGRDLTKDEIDRLWGHDD